MSGLTPMQAACWFGREVNAKLGGVASHLYSEFDGESINLEKLRAALDKLFLTHEMLRLKIDRAGNPSIAEKPSLCVLEIDDFTSLPLEAVKQQLTLKRQEWAHQVLDLRQGKAARFSISLLPDNAFRFHIDTDMIAIDPDSCRLLIEDLATFYEGTVSALPSKPTFFSWLDMEKSDPKLKLQRKADRTWWKSRLTQIAPAPSLPYLDTMQSKVESHHYSAWLDAEQRSGLIALARQHAITPSNLMLGLFARALGKATGDREFRLSVPTFWRPPICEGTECIVGDFVNFVVLNIEMHGAPTLIDFCRQIATKMTSLLSHSSYAGVNVMRDLSLHHGTAQLAPIVFTSAIDLPSGDLFSPRVHKQFGRMNWTTSQGSQVALDSQVVSIDGGIMINWDVRQEALPKEWVSAVFEHFVALTKTVIEAPNLLSSPLDKLQSRLICEESLTTDLTAMQRAYLLGRTTQMPLGGVAMQEQLEYRGSLSPEIVRLRLSKMVVKYPCLRTFVDSKTLKLRTSHCPQVNVSYVDLSQISPDNIESELSRRRYAYSHHIFELEQPLWDITLFSLGNGLLHVFARFDALILDARSIASLMVELFEGQAPYLPNIEIASDGSNLNELRSKAKRYWLEKLTHVTGLMPFPWHQPLESISSSRYQRQSLEINKDTMRQLCRVGGEQNLFKNTVIMATVMEVLSHHVEDRKLCVAVPVLPLHSSTYASQSTFIALQWNANQQPFIDRAKQLQSDTFEGLEHLAFSGVDLARILFDKYGPAPTLPIVVTSGLSWPTLSKSAPMTLCRGLTQTPQVAMDVRFVAQANGSVMFSIDYAIDAVSEHLVEELLERIDIVMTHMAETKTFTSPTEDALAKAKSRVMLFKDIAPVVESTPIDSTKLTIFVIYCKVLGVEPKDYVDEKTAFTQLGLRPTHLKQISAELLSEFSVELPMMQLISCSDASEVAALLDDSLVFSE